MLRASIEDTKLFAKINNKHRGHAEDGENLSPAEDVDMVSPYVSPNAVDPGALEAGTLGAGSTSPKLVYGTDEVPEAHGGSSRSSEEVIFLLAILT